MIKKLIRWIWGCPGNCQWETIRVGRYETTRDGEPWRSGTMYHQRCTTCGEMKGVQI